MFAVIKTGGKQYRVAADDVFVVEKLEGEPGSTVTFSEVLLVGGEKAIVGAPTVAGAFVTAELMSTQKGDKVMVVKKRRRSTYRRRKGHRQLGTTVRVTSINAGAAA